jgi:hypothetical protein
MCSLLLVAWLGAALPAGAAELVNEVTLVGRSVQFDQVAPQPRSFTVSTAGRYAVTLTDIGFPIGSTLLSVDLIITKGTRTIARATRLGTQEFDATPGTYTVNVLGNGAPAGFATVGVAVAQISGGAPLLQYQTGLSGNPVPAPTNQSSLAERFAAKFAGTYQVTLTDRRFPAALTSIDLLIVDGSGAPVARLCQPARPPACDSLPISFAANPGNFDLFVNARAADPLKAGLYSVAVSGGASPVTLYAATHPVGSLQSHALIEFPAQGSYSLTVNDLRLPVPLANVSAVIAQRGGLLTSVTGANTQTFNADQGQATLYTTASPATANGTGAFGVFVPYGTQTLYSDAKAVVGATASGARAYVFMGSFPSAGDYRIQVKDFGFPTSIPALQLLVTQDGAPLGLGAVPSGGSLTVPAKAGQFMIVAIANVLSSTATGLFGVTVDAQPSGAEVLTIAQGIGDIYHAKPLNVANAGMFDVTLSDSAFPAPFENLALVVTRGTTMVGKIFGGGTFSFAATPGAYSLNFIAGNASNTNYGLYGLMIEDAVPRLTFTASTQSVPPQGSATVSWSAPGATSCDATGGWSGNRPTSGTNVTVGPFGANTTLTLTCTGPGGTSSASVSIAVPTAASATTRAGGAGGMTAWQLLAMAFLLGLKGIRRVQLGRGPG